MRGGGGRRCLSVLVHHPPPLGLGLLHTQTRLNDWLIDREMVWQKIWEIRGVCFRSRLFFFELTVFGCLLSSFFCLSLIFYSTEYAPFVPIILEYTHHPSPLSQIIFLARGPWDPLTQPRNKNCLRDSLMLNHSNFFIFYFLFFCKNFVSIVQKNFYIKWTFFSTNLFFKNYEFDLALGEGF